MRTLSPTSDDAARRRAGRRRSAGRSRSARCRAGRSAPGPRRAWQRKRRRARGVPRRDPSTLISASPALRSVDWKRCACPPIIASVSRASVQPASGRRDDAFAVAQHRGRLAKIEHLREAVRDIEDGDALRLAGAASPRTAAAASCGPSGAVGSSRMRILGSVDSALAISTICRCGERQAADLGVGVDCRVRAAARTSAPAVRIASTFEQAEAARFAAERQVLRDGQIQQQAELLVDGGDAERQRMARARGSRPALPPIAMVPASAECMPDRMLISVDLPAPFWPTSAWTSPGRIASDTSSSARTPGKRFGQPLRPPARIAFA